MEIRTSDALVDSMELVTMLAGSREQASLPARHGVVPAVSGVTEHVSPPASGGDFTPPGAGPPDSPSAGTATHLPTRSHPPGEFYRRESPCLPYPAHELSVAGGLERVLTLLLEIQTFGRNPIPGKLIFFLKVTMKVIFGSCRCCYLPPQRVLPIHGPQRRVQTPLYPHASSREEPNPIANST